MQFIIKGINPMGAVRTTRAMAGRTEAGRKYATYKNQIGFAIKQELKQPFKGALAVSMVFYMPIPKYLIGKVKPGQLHTKKPDIDNLVKGLFDAANGISWVDDARVSMITGVTKIYSDDPGIIFDIEQIGDLVHGQPEQTKPRKPSEAKQRAARKNLFRKRRGVRAGF